MSEMIPGFRNCYRFLAPYLRPFRSLFAAAAAATVAEALREAALAARKRAIHIPNKK